MMMIRLLNLAIIKFWKFNWVELFKIKLSLFALYVWKDLWCRFRQTVVIAQLITMHVSTT